MTTIQSNRCYYLDLAKVLTTFLVIIGHLYSTDSTVRLYLYGFHMPLFFIVSGVFHKYIGKINWGHYSRTILWPLLIFIFLSILVNVFLWGMDLSSQLHYFFIDIPKGKINSIHWFLFALFWCKVFMDCFCKSKNKIIPIVLWGCLLFIPVFILRAHLPFALSQGLMAFPFYAIGYYGRGALLKRKESINWSIPLICCLILTVLTTKYVHGRVSMMGVNFGNLEETLFHDSVKSFSVAISSLLSLANILLFYLNGLVGSAMILSFSLLPIPKLRFISSLSKSLITVVGTQSIYINIVSHTWGLDNSFCLSIGLALCILLLCYLTHCILQHLYRLAYPK